jgi:DHA1 family multidrug resistance protein-like MFS transporter
MQEPVVPSRFRITGGLPLLVLVCGVIFVDSVGYGVIVPVLPIYAKTLGVSDFANGILFSAYAIALLAAAIPVGILSDRYGRKPFVLFGMFAMAAAFVFYALAKSYPMLLLARVFDGLTAAATWSAALALLGDRFDEKEMGSRMGWAFSVSAVGAIAGPLIGGIFSDAFGYRSPFFVIAGVCFVGGVFALFLSESRKEKRTEAIGWWRLLKPVFTTRNVLIACVISLVTTMGFGLLDPTLPIYFRRTFGMSRTGIGIVFGVLMLCYAVASPLAGKLSDRLGRRKPIVAGLLVTAIATPFIAVFKNVAAVVLVMAVFGFSVAFFETPSVPLITDTLPKSGQLGGPNQYGAAFGLLNFFWSLGYALGPILGGALMGWAGLLTALIVYSAMLLALALGVVPLLREPSSKEAATSSTSP